MSRTLLARATEGTAAPTPGYLYKDLAQAAAANPSASMEMAQYLTNRLQQKANANIKFKCLKVIAKLCDDVPRNQFRRCVSQNPQGVAAIKEAIHFRGPPDPVRGDEPNQKVRTAAQEALDAVYREAPTSETVGIGGGGISGSYGPSPHAGGGGGMGARRMEGIGNPRYQDPRLDPRFNGNQNITIQDAVREAGEVVLGMIKDPLARNAEVQVPGIATRAGNMPGYANNNPYSGRPPPGSAELARQTGGEWTMASNRGPGSVVHNEEYYKARDQHNNYNWTKSNGVASTSNVSGSVGGSWAAAQPVPSGFVHSAPNVSVSANPHAHTTPVGAPPSDGLYEKNLVLELCPPGGMKPVPPPDKLANFKRIVASLNADLVCPILLDCLEEGQPWIIRAKSLCVIEATIEAGGIPYREFFSACSDEIIPLVNHPRSAIKDPAKRVLQLLGLGSAASAAHQPTAQAPVAAPNVAAPPNLLDFDDEPTTVTQSSPPQQSAPPVAAPAPDTSAALFGGMQVKQKTAPVSVQVQVNSNNLLDFSSPANGDIKSSANNDIFRDSGNSMPSMFDQMKLKDSVTEDKKTDSEDAGDLVREIAPPMGGSAFGFINQNVNGDQKSAPEAVAHPSAPKNAFDPLLASSTQQAHHHKPMQMSQEQMQAMAYQQMMMQKQMQQMQMAYAMQAQQRPGAMGIPPNAPGMQMPGAFPGMMIGSGGMPVMIAANNQHRNSASAGFSFMDAPKSAKKDDKKFDFVKDAMKQNK